MKKAAILACLALSACQASTTQQHAIDRVVLEVPREIKTKPIAFEKVVIKIRRGQSIGKIEGGWLCLKQGEIKVRSGRHQINDETFTDVFREELLNANYNVVGDPDALFEDRSKASAEFRIAGLVTNIEANICYPNSGLGNITKSSGSAFLEVDWQIYSTLNRKVVYRKTTRGSYESDGVQEGNEDLVLEMAFSNAVSNLLADQNFFNLVTIPTNQQREKFSPLLVDLIAQPINSKAREISDTLKSVVTIKSTNGHGSGFLISRDGYIITNEHVVGDAKRVNIMFESGVELVGEVIRTESLRDVALIKAPLNKAIPMSIARNEALIGASVYAIGSPLAEDLHGTVSSGIISAKRNLQDQPYIQSDVNVRPGSSGGPLLNTKGQVIGITVSGKTDQGATAGLNFFIPIQDALASLGLENHSE